MSRRRRAVALLTGIATLGAGIIPLAAPDAGANPVVPITDPANPGDAAVAYPGDFPGTGVVTPVGAEFRLSNAAIEGVVTGGTTPGIGQVRTHGVAQDLAITNLFALKVSGATITPADTVAGPLTATAIAADPDSTTVAERHPGVGTTMTFTYTSGANSFKLRWDTELRDGSNYITSRFHIFDVTGSLAITELRFLDATVTGGRNTGKDDGNPVAVGAKGQETMFVGVENPMAKQTIVGNAISFPIPRAGALAAGSVWDYSAVIGATPAGQLRRAFLYYVERERAHARRPFLHYQSWFDLKPPAEAIVASELNQAIDLFGSELSSRGAKLDSYWIDDGWDYLRSPQVADESNLKVWDFDPTQFPTGFAPQKARAAANGGTLSVWMSPFGGYGTSAATRAALNASKPADQRMERNSGGFALGGERYGARFRQVVYDMMDNQGVQGFKFDGVGGGLHQVGPNLNYLTDYEALLKLMQDMREHNPEVFINTTVGTWGSPYWTWYSDTIWRDGEDAAKAGVGTPREQYINYRDSTVYNYNMAENPLMPLNSIMNHGFIFSNRAPQFQADNDLTKESVRDAVAADMRGYFAMGLSLQELYVRNTLVNASAPNSAWFWDELARNAKWARNNTALLTDTHWLGRDAAAGQLYGTAAWSDVTGTERAMVMLRNPSTEAQTYKLDIGKDLELPARADGRYKLVERDGQHTDIVVERGTPFYLELQPFEVLLFEGAVTDDPLTPSTPPPAVPEPLDPSDWSATASDWESTGENGDPNNAIDGNLSTMWHTQYNPAPAKTHPHWIRIDTGEPTTVGALEYIPRASGTNGSITGYEIWTSTDGVNYTKATEGDFEGKRTKVDLGELTARYFELRTKGALNNGPWATAAEIQLWAPAPVVPPTEEKVAKSGWTIADVDSEELTGESGGANGHAVHAIDDNEATYWHTAYNPSIDPMPHQITVDMGQVETMSRFEYVPRQDVLGANGTISGYELWASVDGVDFTKVSEGEFSGARSSVTLPDVQARYFRLVATSAANGKAFAGAAELNVYSALQPTPSPSPSPSASASPSPSTSPSSSASPSPSASAVPTVTVTVTATATATETATTTATQTVTVTATATVTATTTATATATQTVTAPTQTVTVTVTPSGSASPGVVDVYSTPGLHEVNGRRWYTRCEPYSQTVRCRTDIWATQVRLVKGRFVSSTGWVFNNLTYLPYMTRAEWAGNPLAVAGSWTAVDGRRWRTECDTAVTGADACRSYTWSSFVASEKLPSGSWRHFQSQGWVLNNIVRFKTN